MLTHLTITDFAIIDRLELHLTPGLNVLTGETGAGKSIVVDAIGAVLGSRVGSEQIRAGAERARVEAIFALPTDCDVASILSEHDLSGDVGMLIISRELSHSGRSLARINGRAVTIGLLQQVCRHLVDIHGQSEHLSLLRTAEHIDFLDGYAGLRTQRACISDKVATLRRIRLQIEEIARDEREVARRVDLLRYQVDEIESARLVPGEEEHLRHERDRLANAERLMAGADTAYQSLYGDNGETGTIDLLGQAVARVGEIAQLDSTLEKLRQSLEEALFQIEDIARELREYRDNVEHDPARLESVEERLDLIRRLSRKYGSSIKEILLFAERAKNELGGLVNREGIEADLRAREQALLTEIGILAGDVSKARQQAAVDLANAVETELASLDMARTRFRVAIAQIPSSDGVPVRGLGTCAFDATGIDRVEFMISPNPGEPDKPLARIASGGETSRLMLALKSILARASSVPVLIFDEIDVGIGGRSGYVIGQKLGALARERQVICVTHLAQIASYADTHLQVAKRIVQERTTTEIALLDGDGRVSELAVMLGGIEGSEKARENALEMLRLAAEWKGDHLNGPAD